MNYAAKFLLTVLFGTRLVIATNDGDIMGLPTDRPLIIAHRGSSGMLPEHTVAAYQLAVEQGADIIECDLAVTKDHQLICTHDAWLNATTNVATKRQFDDRVRTYTVSGKRITDYFSIDFTLEEIKTLRKIQDRSYRNQAYNGLFPIATFDEYIAVAQNSTKRTIAIYPETKIPDFFNQHLLPYNTTMEDILLKSLEKHGYVEKSSPCFVQSFNEASLRYISNHTKVPLVFLTSKTLLDSKLSQLSTFCYGLGPSKNIIIQVNAVTNRIIGPTDFVTRAHSFGLKLHPYTFRNEYQFLAWDYGADPYREYQKFIDIGVDGLFTDYPWSLANYLEMEKTSNAATILQPIGHVLGFLLLATFL